MKILHIILALSLVSMISHAQESEPSPFSLGFAVGTGTNIMKYNFTGGPDHVPFKLGYTLSASVSYSIPLIEQTNLEIILQGLHAYSSTGTSTLPVGKFELNVEHTNILSWLRCIGSGTLSPFIEVGIGYGRVAFSENITSQAVPGGYGKNSGLVVGGGGGLSYKLSDQIRLQASTQTTYLIKDVYLVDRWKVGFNSPAILMVSLRMVYSL